MSHFRSSTSVRKAAYKRQQENMKAARLERIRRFEEKVAAAESDDVREFWQELLDEARVPPAKEQTP